jgi:hypothetical protein
MYNEDRDNPDDIVQQVMDGSHWEELIEHFKRGKSDFVSEAAFIIMDSIQKPSDPKQVLDQLQALLEGEIDGFAEDFYD